MSKKILYLLLALTFFLAPALGLAAEQRAGEQIVVGSSEVVRDNLYIAGGEVVVDGSVEGDLFVAAGNLTITGEVMGDVLVFAGTVKVNGKIGGDLRTGAGEVDISGEVAGEVLAGVGTFNLLKDGKVGGEILAGIGTAMISGQTEGLRLQTGNLTINDSANIKGDLEYYSSREGNISDKATIAGQTDFIEIEDYNRNYYRSGFDYTGKIYSLLSSILVALLLVYLLPIISSKLANSWREKAGINFVWGFLFLIAVPIVAIFLTMLVLSIPLAIGLIMIYTIILYLSKIAAIVGLGYCIQKYFADKDKKSQTIKLDWITVLIGALIYYLVGLIPLLGGLTTFVLSMIGLGAIVSIKYGWLKNLKKNKQI